jgi:hypothetical protein
MFRAAKKASKMDGEEIISLPLCQALGKTQTNLVLDRPIAATKRITTALLRIGCRTMKAAKVRIRITQAGKNLAPGAVGRRTLRTNPLNRTLVGSLAGTMRTATRKIKPRKEVPFGAMRARAQRRRPSKERMRGKLLAGTMEIARRKIKLTREEAAGKMTLASQTIRGTATEMPALGENQERIIGRQTTAIRMHRTMPLGGLHGYRQSLETTTRVIRMMLMEVALKQVGTEITVTKTSRMIPRMGMYGEEVAEGKKELGTPAITMRKLKRRMLPVRKDGVVHRLGMLIMTMGRRISLPENKTGELRSRTTARKAARRTMQLAAAGEKQR